MAAERSERNNNRRSARVKTIWIKHARITHEDHHGDRNASAKELLFVKFAIGEHICNLKVRVNNVLSKQIKLFDNLDFVLSSSWNLRVWLIKEWEKKKVQERTQSLKIRKKVLPSLLIKRMREIC